MQKAEPDDVGDKSVILNERMSSKTPIVRAFSIFITLDIPLSLFLNGDGVRGVIANYLIILRRPI